MSTSNKFFEKIFKENDKISNTDFYKTQTFVNYSQEELQFLKYLSFYSKYKSFIRNYLENRNVRNSDKKNYLDIYKQTLTYDEYIRYNTISDNLRVCYENNFYIFGTIFSLGYLILTFKSPSIYIGGKDTSKIFLFSFLCSYAYYKYNYTNYSNELNNLYSNISKRLNDNPELKLRPNRDYFDEDCDNEI
jgi:hypothetical protein